MSEGFKIGDETVFPGERRTVCLPMGWLPNQAPITLPVHVICGSKPGPVLFLSAAVHGNEITGIEIIRRVLQNKALRKLRGTILAVPIVNALGYINHSRYLPDGRDLNRSFPGSDRGSLASVLADLFMREILLRSHYGIDLHSAGAHRTNFPQLRIAPKRPELVELAQAFCPPVVLISSLREGSLREQALKHEIPVLLYEAGEALRLDPLSVRFGVLGIFRVLKYLEMLKVKSIQIPKIMPVFSSSSTWVRAPEGGIFLPKALKGEHVHTSHILGVVSTPFGEWKTPVVSMDDGILIAHSNLPVVNKGDALFHIARLKDTTGALSRLGQIETQSEAAFLDDEDEIL